MCNVVTSKILDIAFLIILYIFKFYYYVYCYVKYIGNSLRVNSQFQFASSLLDINLNKEVYYVWYNNGNKTSRNKKTYYITRVITSLL